VKPVAARHPQRKRTPIVLVFGENPHDSLSLAALIRSIRPDLVGGVETSRRPASLTREASPPKVKNWVSEIARVVAATTAAGRPVAAVVVHRDADRVDLKGEEEQRLANGLAGLPHAVPAVPVVAIESWWFYFGDATESVVRGWKLPAKEQNWDSIGSPKRELQDLTRRTKRTYAEADSPAIAARAQLTRTRGSSPSFERFANRVRLIPLAPTAL